MFDGCLFVATVGTSLFMSESASIGQCGLSDQRSIISNSGKPKRAMKPTRLKIMKGGLGLGNPMPKITKSLLQLF